MWDGTPFMLSGSAALEPEPRDVDRPLRRAPKERILTVVPDEPEEHDAE